MACAEIPQQLFVKSFFGVSVPEAMDQARVELGPDALLLNTREAPPEARHLGRYEVVFGRWPESGAAAAPAEAAPNGVDDLRRRVEEIRDMLTRIGPAPASSRNGRGIVQQALIEAGVEETLAREIEDAVRQRMTKRSVFEIGRPRTAPESEPDGVVFETVGEIGSRFEVRPELGRVSAFVGPPGAGKTTTLVKLAIAQGLAIGRAVRLVTIDTQRIGAAEQLRTYAAILGVPFHAVENPAALEQVVDSIPEETLVLIDTPGFSASMLQDLGMELAGFLNRRQDIDTHLILTASMRQEDLRRAVERFSIFSPAKLLFTRLDETTSFSGVFCEAARTHKPLSFFCHGQSIPEDLEAASKMRVIESLVSQLPKALEAVA